MSGFCSQLRGEWSKSPMGRSVWHLQMYGIYIGESRVETQASMFNEHLPSETVSRDPRNVITIGLN